jgi:hypothetical protein
LASLDAANVMRLAEELAMRVDNAHVVLARNGISTAEWAVLKSSPAFRTYLKEAIERWQSPAMSEARIAAKAVHLVEANLPHMAHIIEDRTAPAAARVGAFGQVRTLSGLGAGKEDDSARDRDRFVLNIVLGPGAAPLTIEGEVADGVVAGGTGEAALPAPTE